MQHTQSTALLKADGAHRHPECSGRCQTEMLTVLQDEVLNRASALQLVMNMLHLVHFKLTDVLENQKKQFFLWEGPAKDAKHTK